MRRSYLIAASVVFVIAFAMLLGVIGRNSQNGTPALRATNSPTSLPTQNTTTVPKKLIEYGWDVPSPAFLPANIRAMEQRPFEGVMVRLSVGPYIFTNTAYRDAEYDQDRKDLKATHFNRFTDNFVLVWASSKPGWNWLNDADWAAAEQNIRNFARTAAAGGFKGFLFDTETYGPNTWGYSASDYPNTTFQQVQTLMRQRGARFMDILQGEIPGARVLFSWLLNKIQGEYEFTGGNLANGTMPLFSAFVEGAYNAANSNTRVIDGNEESYNFTDAKSFDQARNRILNAITHLDTSYQSAAYTHTQIAQAIYADSLLNLLNSPRSIGLYVDGQQARITLLEHNVYNALRTSDEYVWFYSENINWWNTPKIPDGVEDAIRRAKSAQASGQTPAYDMRPVEAAVQAMSQMLTLSGRITAWVGATPQHVIVDSGFSRWDGVEMSCYVFPNDTFDCKVPRGWSGTLKPRLEGYTFDPPSIKFQNVTQDGRADFTAIPLITF